MDIAPITSWALGLAVLAAVIPACGSGQKDAGAGSGQPGPDPTRASEEQIAEGRRLYLVRGCVTCHTTDGRASTGPSLLGLYGEPQWLTSGERVIVDAAYIRRSILEPNVEIAEGYIPNQMQSYASLLSDEEIEALTAFIASLRNKAPDAAQGAAAPEDAAPPADALGVRPDGRPSWWFDDVQRASGRLQACGEALGADLAEARAGAVADAQRALRTHLGRSEDARLDDERADLSVVWPLPNPGGDQRYAGYVMLSVEHAGGEAADASSATPRG